MKVIDEKGKLFGKLNIIDLLVIVLIIAAVAVVGVKFLGGGDTAAVPVTRLTYTVRMTAQDEVLAEQLAEYVDADAGKRDQLMAGGNYVDAYVVDFWTEPTRYNRNGSNEVMVLDEAEAAAAGLVDICVKIEANVTNTVTNEVGTQEVRVGKTHIVKTTHMEFLLGFIESCEWEPVA